MLYRSIWFRACVDWLAPKKGSKPHRSLTLSEGKQPSVYIIILTRSGGVSSHARRTGAQRPYEPAWQLLLRPRIAEVEKMLGKQLARRLDRRGHSCNKHGRTQLDASGSYSIARGTDCGRTVISIPFCSERRHHLASHR